MNKTFNKISKICLGVGVLMLLMFLFATKAQAFSGFGSGTTDSPYRIASCYQLQEIRYNPDAYYVLSKNIDCSETSGWNEAINGFAGFLPIADFTGTLDGLNRTIDHLYIYSDSVSTGLFSSLDGATVKNIKFTNASVTGLNPSGYTTGLSAYASNNTVISGVSFNGIIRGYAVGGLVGLLRSGSTISRSSTHGTVDTRIYDDNGVSRGTETGVGGGLIDYSQNGNIYDSYTDVILYVRDGGAIARGLYVGESNTSIFQNTYSNATLNLTNYTTSFVTNLEVYGQLNFINNISASAKGVGFETPQNFYWTGPIPTFSNSFYDSTKSGRANCGYSGSPENCTDIDSTTLYNTSTVAPFKVGDNQLWDFTNVWQLNETGLPTLRDVVLEEFAGGNGAEATPYMIETCAQLTKVNYDLAAHYQLKNNLSCASSVNNIIIGTPNTPFTGVFDGVGYTIDIAINVPNVTVYSSLPYLMYDGVYRVALFPAVNGGTIKDLGISGSSTNGDSMYLSGLASRVWGGSVIERVASSVNVNDTTGSGAGGLVSSLESSSIIDSYSTGTVYSSNKAGGLVMSMVSGTIQNSYNTGSISANNYYAGGIVGEFKGGTISNSFSVGSTLGSRDGGLIGLMADSGALSLSTVSNNFFDISRTTKSYCWTDSSDNKVHINPATGICLGVNAVVDGAWSQPNYFKGNSASAVFTGWNFTSNTGVWNTFTGGYPELQSIIGDGVVIDDIPSAPGTPTNLSNDGVTSSAVVLSWTAPVVNEASAITNYIIEYSLHDQNIWTTVDKTESTDTYYEVTGLAVSTEYDFRVHAVNILTEGPISDIYSTFTTELEATPSAPQNLTATQNGRNPFSVNLSWEDPLNAGVPAFSGYYFEYKFSIDDWNNLEGSNNIPSSQNSYQILLSDTNDLSYDFRIRAYNNTGDSDFSNIATYVVPPAIVLDGAGTEARPYLITSCSELQSLTNKNSGGLYVLANDIDCTETSGWNDNGEGGFAGFIPINNFYGTLDGQGHNITNLYINPPNSYDPVGLFAYWNDGSIHSLSNFNLVNANITGWNYVGALVGYSQGGINIANISVSGEIHGQQFVGGFVGVLTYGEVNIKNSYNKANVSADGSTVGGIIGQIYQPYGNGILDKVYSAGSISAQGYDGGLIGLLDFGYWDYNFTISNSFSANISTTDTYGSLVSRVQSYVGTNIIYVNNTFFDEALISNPVFVDSLSSANVSNTNSSSFDSELTPNYLKNSSIDIPFKVGDTQIWDFNNTWVKVEGGFPVLRSDVDFTGPGVVTDLTTIITNRNEINISWTAPSSTGSYPLYGYDVMIKQYGDQYSWDEALLNYNVETTSYDFSNYLPLNTTYNIRVRSNTAYIPSEWATSTITTDPQETYEIDDCQALQDMASDLNTWQDKFVLTADIDCSDTVNWNPVVAHCSYSEYDNEVECTDNNNIWYPNYNAGFVPIGWDGNSFKGTFDGANHSISGLTIYRPEYGYTGLFRSLENGAIIKNLNISSGSIAGESYVGAIAGEALEGVTIDNVTSSINVSGITNYSCGEGCGWFGGYEVGGLIGSYESNDAGLTLTDNTINGAVAGIHTVGGLVGYMYEYNDVSYTSTLSGNTINGKISALKDGEDSYYQDQGDSIGGLVGYYEYYSYNDSKNFRLEVENNTISDTSGIAGYEYVGGLFGYIDLYSEYDDSIITIDMGPNNAVLGDVSSASNNVGGLIGYLYYGDDTSGSNMNLNIFQSFVEADVSGVYDHAGGLIGMNNLYCDSDCLYKINIEDSYYKGNISGSSYVGGLIGYAYDDYWENETLDIARSYAVGTVTADINDEGSNTAGGLIGWSEMISSITSSFTANIVDGNGPYNDGYDYAGTFIGGGYYEGVYLYDSYYDQGKNPDIEGYSAMACTVGGSMLNCAAVNADGLEPDYFFNNSDHVPFYGEGPVWDFTTIWKTNTSDYPTFLFEEEEIIPTCSVSNASTYDNDCKVLTCNQGYVLSGGVCNLVRHSSSGSSTTGRIINTNITPVVNTTITSPTSNPLTAVLTFTRTLKLKMIGDDVKALQVYLNTHGFLLASIGVGSPGKETTLFGPLTKKAVIKFQLANGLKGDGVVGPLTQAKLK